MVTKTPKPNPYTSAEKRQMRLDGEHFSEPGDSGLCDHAQCWCGQPETVREKLARVVVVEASVVVAALLFGIAILIFAVTIGSK